MTTARKTSADFKVGQIVRCSNPQFFMAEKSKYLTDRLGTVVNVFPANSTDKHDFSHINMVSVMWHKRNGRGVAKSMIIHPHLLEYADVSSSPNGGEK